MVEGTLIILHTNTKKWGEGVWSLSFPTTRNIRINNIRIIYK